jgi:hypothetical protein
MSKGNLLPPLSPFKKFRVQTTCVQRTIALLHSPGQPVQTQKKHAKLVAYVMRCMNVTTLTFGEEDLVCMNVTTLTFGEEDLVCVIRDVKSVFWCHPIYLQKLTNNNNQQPSLFVC